MNTGITKKKKVRTAVSRTRRTKLRTRRIAQRARLAVKNSQEDGFARPMGGARNSWWWGANGSVAGQTFLLHLADRLQPDPRYRATAPSSTPWLPWPIRLLPVNEAAAFTGPATVQG